MAIRTRLLARVASLPIAERPVEQVDVVSLYSAVAGTFPASLVPGQPVVTASAPPFVPGKPKLVDRPKLASACWPPSSSPHRIRASQPVPRRQPPMRR